jgi:hypothetical protein
MAHVKDNEIVFGDDNADDGQPQKRWVKGAFFESRGRTKRPTLQELRNSRDGNTVNVADSTDAEIVKEILHRANLTESPFYEQLVEIFANALLNDVEEPLKWANPNYGVEGSRK